MHKSSFRYLSESWKNCTSSTTAPTYRATQTVTAGLGSHLAHAQRSRTSQRLCPASLGRRASPRSSAVPAAAVLPPGNLSRASPPAALRLHLLPRFLRTALSPSTKPGPGITDAPATRPLTANSFPEASRQPEWITGGVRSEFRRGIGKLFSNSLKLELNHDVKKHASTCT